MDNHKAHKTFTLKRFIPITLCIAVLGVFCYASWIAYQYELQLEKKKANDELSLVTNRIESLLNLQLDKAQGLAAFSQSNPGASFDTLTQFCEKLFQNQGDILKTVVLTKDTTVKFIYPLTGNESVLGVDLATVANQKDAVLQAKKTRRTIITQPVELIQGGMGIICRVPLSTYENGLPKDFIGLMNVVINFDRYLGASGILHATKTYHLSIYDTDDGDSSQYKIFNSSEKSMTDPIELPILLRESNWILTAEPIDGWQPSPVLHVAILITGFVAAFLVYFYISLMLRSQAQLNRLVDERTDELTQTNQYLEESLATVEEKQAELELLNDKLEASIEDLHLTQEQLIQSEKLAALGELVAGVAHEINTPLGVGITLTSFFKEKQDHLRALYDVNQLTKKDLGDYIHATEEAIEVLDSSLNRAAEIVKSFKTVAIEQATLEMRSFNLYQYINDVLLNLKPKLKTTQHEIRFICDEGLEIVSYPGAISHILTNLIVNSLIHGFEGVETGHITIIVEKTGSMLHLIYSDDGVGIPKELQSKIFNPFFTTKKIKGGTGLGLHIVHNMITQVLKGRIQLTSSPGNGAEFSIHFPDMRELAKEQSTSTD